MPSRTAQRRTRPAAKNGAKPEPKSTDPVLVGEVPAEQAAQGEQPPGVAVLRNRTPDGGEDLQIITLGGMDPLAVPTVLELAIKIHKEKFGLTERK